MKKFFRKINAIFLALLPIFDVYVAGNLPFGYGTFFLLIAGILSLSLKPNIDNKSPLIWILLLMGLSIITYLIQRGQQWFSSSLWLHNLIATAVVLFILFSAGRRASISTFFRIGLIMALLASVICILQRFSLIMTGSFEQVFISGLDAMREVETRSISRPSAFFSEPAHFCIYVVPMLYYAMTSHMILSSLVLAAGVLSSGSTTGFLLLGMLILLYFFSNASGRAKTIALLILAIACILLVRYVPSILQENIDKYSEVDVSSNIRLFGGVFYWKFFTAKEFLFGIGHNQLENYARSFLLEAENYSSAIIYSLTCFGIVGLGITVFFIIRLFLFNRNNLGAFLIFLGVFFSDQILFNCHLIYLLTFMTYMKAVISRKEKTI